MNPAACWQGPGVEASKIAVVEANDEKSTAKLVAAAEPRRVETHCLAPEGAPSPKRPLCVALLVFVLTTVLCWKFIGVRMPSDLSSFTTEQLLSEIAQRGLVAPPSPRSPALPPLLPTPLPPLPPSPLLPPAPPGLFCHNHHELPSLYLIGAQKCGTTSLTEALFDAGFGGAGHAWRDRPWVGHCWTGPPGSCRGGFPDMVKYFTTEKEAHFFDTWGRLERGLDWMVLAYPKCHEGIPTLDATPDYFQTVSATRLPDLYGPKLMKHTTLVFLLCDPIRRAQSYYYWTLYGSDQMTFGQYVHAHTKGGTTAIQNPNDEIWQLGYYANDLSRWLDKLAHSGAVIIPATAYYKEPDVLLTALLQHWSQKSGKPLPSGATLATKSVTEAVPTLEVRTPPPPPPRLNHNAHADLAQDVTDHSDRATLKEMYHLSNSRVYEYANSPHVTVLPYGPGHPKYDPDFLRPGWEN